MHTRHLTLLLLCLLWAAPALAAPTLALDCPAEVPEGTAFTATLRSSAPLGHVDFTWLGNTVRAATAPVGDGHAATVLLGMGMKERLEGAEHTLTVDAAGQSLTRAVRRAPKAYPEQRLKVARKYTSLSEENLARYRREKKDILAALSTVSPEARWTLPLAYPSAREVPVTSPFGLRRFFNGEPRAPHSGLDLGMPQGAEVRCLAAGRVLLAADHFFSGNCVYVDHGQGVVSMYLHLSKVLVEPGQELAAGAPVGLVGSTGRVTGPHLHLGLSVLGQRVDPAPLLASPQ